ncbi:tRNA (N6-threonylcarbamoyladenosine(37)-N6)-methyltransferase TrmO [Spongorhabdus nitratireducens]
MDSTLPPSYQFEPIGYIRSCFKQKFGIPRQPGLAPAAHATLELLPPYNRPEALKGLNGFSHLWIQFVFHQTADEGWRPTVRPPRLGGSTRIGVFATRATHRPNPMGMSVVELRGVSEANGSCSIELGAVDLLDGTPVLDIKPYLPYSDSIPDAKTGFAPVAPELVPVQFSPAADQYCINYEADRGRPLKALIEQVISQDPRPAYLQRRPGRRHVLELWNLEIIWYSKEDHFLIDSIESVTP